MTAEFTWEGAAGQGQGLPEAITFVEPPPGMPDLTHCSLTALDDSGFLFALRSVDREGTRLFVISPHASFADYAPEVTPAVREALGMAHGMEPLLLVVVHTGHDGASTANLLAPIVVAPFTGMAIQMVIDGDASNLLAPLLTGEAAA